jgi:two-component system response regulator ResD
MRRKAMDKILVVDDEDQMRKYMLDVLRGEGYAVSEASDGKRAIQVIQEAAFHLIITDVAMPEMDGLELIRKVRERLPNAKILAISGDCCDGPDLYLKLAKHFGANSILSKPFGPNRFIDKVSSLLRN